MLPNNVHKSHEIVVLVDIFSMGFSQVNRIFNDLSKILDLIFFNNVVNSNKELCNVP